MTELKTLTENIVHVPFRLSENGKYLNLQILHPHGYTFVEIAKCYPYDSKKHFKIDYNEFYSSLKATYGVNKPFSIICLMNKVQSPEGRKWWQLLLTAKYHNNDCLIEIRPTFRSPKQMQHWGNMLHNLSESITYWKDEIEVNNPDNTENQTANWVPKE